MRFGDAAAVPCVKSVRGILYTKVKEYNRSSITSSSKALAFVQRHKCCRHGHGTVGKSNYVVLGWVPGLGLASYSSLSLAEEAELLVSAER